MFFLFFVCRDYNSQVIFTWQPCTRTDCPGRGARHGHNCWTKRPDFIQLSKSSEGSEHFSLCLTIYELIVMRRKWFIFFSLHRLLWNIRCCGKNAMESHQKWAVKEVIINIIWLLFWFEISQTFLLLSFKECNYNIAVMHKRNETNQTFVCGTNGQENVCCSMVGYWCAGYAKKMDGSFCFAINFAWE